MKVAKTLSPLILPLVLAVIFLSQDFLSFAIWWLMLLGLGAIFFPAACFLFRRFLSKGYSFARTLGIAVGGYLTWLASALHILPFQWWAAYLVLAVCLALNIYLAKKTGCVKEAFQDGKLLGRIAFEEALFILLLAFWAYLRGLRPDIIGLEKYMDLGFVNSILRSDYFPPADMWYAGKPINYYYLGQYFAAYMTRLTFIKPGVTYNLSMATLFAVVFMAAYSIGQFLSEIYSQNTSSKVAKTARLATGLLTGGLTCLSGNLHTVIYAWFGNGGPLGYYYFPDATRYIGHNPPGSQTIHEFPLYSFVVSDLHAHVLNMLFTLLAVACAISAGMGILRKFRFDDQEANAGFKRFVPEPAYFVAIFLIGLFPATNFWDFPIYIVATGAIYLYANLKSHNYSKLSWKAFFGQLGFAAGASYLVVLPFHLKFEPMTTALAQVTVGSAFYQLMVLYGYQLVFFAVLLIETTLAYKAPKSQRPLSRKEQKRLDKAPIDDTPKPLYIPAGDAAEMEGKKPVFRYIESANPGDALACIFFICAVGLVIIPEIVYVKDIYTTSPRANTMFKLCYQAFIMFTLGIGYTFPRVFMHLDKKNRRYLITLAVSSILIFFAFVYPFYAIPGWYGKGRTYAGLDGTQFLSTYKETLGEPGPEGPPKEVLSMVDDVPIVEYLNNIKGQPVICEANEFAYKSYGRISATTGLPDIFNWYYHQVLWRTEDRKPEFDERIQDIKTIYTTSDPSAAKAALDKYKVKYIVVGLLERTKFSDRLNEELIKSLGTIVVQSNSTYLLEVSQ